MGSLFMGLLDAAFSLVQEAKNGSDNLAWAAMSACGHPVVEKGLGFRCLRDASRLAGCHILPEPKQYSAASTVDTQHCSQGFGKYLNNFD
jgi:hypothetical protein